MFPRPTHKQGEIREVYHVYVCVDTLVDFKCSLKSADIKVAFEKTREIVASVMGHNYANALNLHNVGYNDVTIVMEDKALVEEFINTMYDQFPEAPAWWKEETGARNLYAQYMEERWEWFNEPATDPEFEWGWGMWECTAPGDIMLAKADC